MVSYNSKRQRDEANAQLPPMSYTLGHWLKYIGEREVSEI